MVWGVQLINPLLWRELRSRLGSLLEMPTDSGREANTEEDS